MITLFFAISTAGYAFITFLIIQSIVKQLAELENKIKELEQTGIDIKNRAEKIRNELNEITEKVCQKK